MKKKKEEEEKKKKKKKKKKKNNNKKKYYFRYDNLKMGYSSQVVQICSYFPNRGWSVWTLVWHNKLMW
jgi:hypothetical protein